MDDVNTVYISNLRLGITDGEIAKFLMFLGFENFVVQLGIKSEGRSTNRCAFCFVECEHMLDANDMRYTLTEVSAHI